MELKTTDLRIGNRFNIKTRFGETELVTVWGISNYNSGHIIDEDYSAFGLDELIPITITEKQIVKLGFEKVENPNNIKLLDGLFHKNRNYNYDEVRFYKNGRIDFRIGSYKKANAIYKNDKRPKYVHQLQNLYFALTGSELVFSEA